MATSSIRLLTLSRNLVTIGGFAMLLAAGCGEEDPAKPSDTDKDPSTEEESDDDSETDEGKTDGDDDSKPDNVGDKADASAPAIDGGSKPVATNDAGTQSSQDASSVVTDSGSKPTDAAQPPTSDAGSAVATGVCDEKTPHGCYVKQQAESHPKCPAQSPEQSAGWPNPLTDPWNGCGDVMSTVDLAQDPEAACIYKGPKGEIANCRCDSNLHWLCSCSADLWSGVFQWPNCSK